MKHFKYFCAIFAASVFLMVPQLAHAEVKIVSSLGDLAAMAREVGGDNADVELLASPHEDPHFVDAKPSFVAHVAKADVLLVNGMSLEIGWLPTLVRNSHNPKIQRGADGYFDASQFVERKGVPTTKVTRAAGDIHPQGNPHFTPDPRQMARVALAFGKRLAKVDPAHADAYKKRARAFAKKALQTAKFWHKKFRDMPAKCRQIVVYHEAWTYVTGWLGLNVAIPVEPKPGVPPNPKHVAEVFKTVKKQQVPAIIEMEYYPDSNTEMIAKRTGAYLLTVQGQAREDEDYFTRVNKMAGELYSALKARCE